MMRGATAGVQRKMQDVYPNAHYIHCYAHQLNLIMQQATSHIPKVRIFFSDLGGFASFFSRSPKCTGVLDKVVAHRLPTSSRVRWNFHSRAINSVFEHREDLICCFQTIRDSGDFDPVTVREAGTFAMLLEDQDFNFFLQLFHNIMPHVDHFYAKLQKKDIDSVHIRGSIQQFQQDIQKIRNSLHSLVDQSSEGGSQPKRRRSLSPEVHERIAAEVSFYCSQNKPLPTRLLFLVCGINVRSNNMVVTKDFYNYPQKEVFSETVTLLKILVTTPMTTAEAERCFSTLKRIKTYLRNNMTQERLNALAMLSMEKRLVTEMTDFNQVIEKFASQKERRAKFIFK
ncbi:uncharacterized protein LOC107722802 [Sinocyclocheilus rhinocerous]|uniref:uncharacterized protein LOC107722802 n=1 Tax=Sinocyclocheilus rhinocerous TaxID=307959 RepID=UPI0007B7B12F|nr:PREDICTED: uncharacterized protein LOC107722802 [Sinocyclocheilus rhinocerous]